MHAVSENLFCEIFYTVKNFDTFMHSCTYAHSDSRASPTTSWKVTRAIGEFFVPIHSKSLWRNFVVYGTCKYRIQTLG